MCAGFMSFCTINGCWLVCNLLLLSWLFFLIYKPSKSLTTVLGTIILTRGTKSILQCTRSWSWCPPVSRYFTCSVTWPHVDMLWMKSLRVTINWFAVGFKGIGFLSPISSISLPLLQEADKHIAWAWLRRKRRCFPSAALCLSFPRHCGEKLQGGCRCHDSLWRRPLMVGFVAVKLLLNHNVLYSEG